jgi:hypothetical protein
MDRSNRFSTGRDRIGLEFVYGYLVAKRKGIVDRFIRQVCEEYHTTESQVRQWIEELGELIVKLRRDSNDKGS